MLRFICRSLLIGIVFTVLGGCTTRDLSVPAQKLKQPDPGLTLEIWLPEQDNDFYSQLAEAYEQENPEINIQIKEISPGDYTFQLARSISEQKGPDLALISNLQFIIDGYFLPLEETIGLFHVPIEDFNQAAMSNSCTFRDRIYCLGTFTSAYVLFYNPALLGEYGKSFPASSKSFTMADFVNLITVYNENNSDPANRIWGSSFPYPYLWSDRRTLFSTDGKTTYRLANDESTINAYQLLADSCKKQNSICQTGEHSDNEMIALFLKKQLAMMISPSHLALPEIENASMPWGAAFVPTEKPDDAPWTTAWTDGFGVLVTSRHQEEALRFLAFLGNRGSELREKSGDFPLNMRTAQIWAGSQNARLKVYQIIKAAEKEIFIPDFNQVTHRMDIAFDEMVNGNLSAKDALNETAPLMQSDLDRSWIQFEARSGN